MLYSELLKNPEWQKKRLQIMDRDGWACRCCKSTDKELQVHHIKYEGSKPWETSDKYLVTLCRECHELEEFLKDKDLYKVAIESGLTRVEIGHLILNH